MTLRSSTAVFKRFLFARAQQVGLSAILKLNSETYNISNKLLTRRFASAHGSYRIFQKRADVFTSLKMPLKILPEVTLRLQSRTFTASSWLGNKGLHENPRNEKIRARTVVLIDEDGTKLATVPIKHALEKARDKQLELVELQKQMGTRAAVCKMYSRKAIYEAEKKYKHNTPLGSKMKELTVTGRIAPQDLQWKIKKINYFLDHGNSVKLSITRKPYHKITDEEKLDIVRKVVEGTKEFGVLDEQPKRIGSLILRCMFKPIKQHGETQGDSKS